MEERKDGFLYDSAGNQVGFHGKVSKSKPQNFNFILILLLGFALYESASKWKHDISSYWGNLINHSRQIFHFEPLLYIFLMFILLRLALKRVL